MGTVLPYALPRLLCQESGAGAGSDFGLVHTRGLNANLGNGLDLLSPAGTGKRVLSQRAHAASILSADTAWILCTHVYRPGHGLSISLLQVF